MGAGVPATVDSCWLLDPVGLLDSVCPQGGWCRKRNNMGLGETPALTCLHPPTWRLWGSPRSVLSLPPLKGIYSAGWSGGWGALGWGPRASAAAQLWPPSLELSSQLFQQVWPQGREWAAMCPLSPPGPQICSPSLPAPISAITQRYLLTSEGQRPWERGSGWGWSDGG